MRTKESTNYTNRKEEEGRKVLMHHWKEIYPEAKSVRWNNSKEYQIKGVDFIVTRKDGSFFRVDLKALGFKPGLNYDMTLDDYNGTPCRYYERQKGLTIELFYFNRGLKEWSFTNTKRKLTDEVLYIVSDVDGIGYYRMSYQDVKNISHQHVTSVCYTKNTFVGPYKAHSSREGSGWYIKFPVFLKRIKDII